MSIRRSAGVGAAVVPVALLVVVGYLAATVGASTVVIGFENHAEGTELTTQYREAGVVFEPQGNESAGALVRTCDPQDVCTSALEGKKAAVTPIYVEPVVNRQPRILRRPLVASFTRPQESVELYVRETEGVDGVQTAELLARNTAGDVVAEDAVRFEAGSGWHRLGLSTRRATIDTVTLTLEDGQGIRHNFFVVDGLAFRVNDPPTATFDYSPGTPTVDDPVTLNASGSSDPDGEIVEYRWDLDDDGSPDRVTQVPTTTVEWGEPGTYPVTLVVADGDGATDSTTRDVTVRADPVARCSIDETEVEPGEAVLIDASESNADLLRFDVDGDEGFDRVNEEGFREAVSYSESGDVTPVIRAEIGAETHTSSCPTVEVNRPPTAAITPPRTAPTVDRSVTLDASGSSDTDGEIVRYAWDFDDDGVFDRNTTSRRVTHTFREGGRHTVSLTVVDDDGAAGRTERSVRINERPTAVFATSPDDPTVGDPVRFDASDSVDPDGEIVEYRWDFDDDDDPDHTAASPETTYTFDEERTYTVSLAVVDDDGAIGRTRASVLINQIPTPALVVRPDDPTVGDRVTFDASGSSDPDGEIVEYRWDLEGAAERTTLVPRTTHTFEEGGTYTVTLAVVDDGGAVGRTETTVGVNGRPTAAIAPPSAIPTADESVTFDASGSDDPDGEIVQYRWDLDGDGDPERNTTTPRTEHTFSEGGRNTVTLAVVDDDGAVGRTERSIRVNERPTPVLADPPDEIRADESVTFDASDSVDPDGDVVEYRWDFDGDGVVDRNTTSPTVTHVYEASGTYDVSLVVVDDLGGVGRAGMSVRVENSLPPGVDLAVGGVGGLVGVLVLRRVRPWPPTNGSNVGRRPDDGEDGKRENRSPQATIAYGPKNPVAPGLVVFDGGWSFDPDEGDRIVRYRWTVDGERESGRQVPYVVAEGGDYEVELEVRDGHGAVGTATTTVTVEEREGDLELDRVHPGGSGAGAGAGDGEVEVEGEGSPDREFLVFRNTGNGTLGLAGWTVRDLADEPGEDRRGADEHAFEFPDGVRLPPDATVTVHTGTGPEGEDRIRDANGDRHLYWGESRSVWGDEADTVVVEDDAGRPVMAVRYERTDRGEYDTEDLDVEVLEDWPVDVVVSSRREAPLVSIGVGAGAVLGLLSSVAGVSVGATFLRGPQRFVWSWFIIAEYLLMSTLTWGTSTLVVGLPESVDVGVPVLSFAGSLTMLLVGLVVLFLWRMGSSLRRWLGSHVG